MGLDFVLEESEIAEDGLRSGASRIPKPDSSLLGLFRLLGLELAAGLLDGRL